MSWREALGACSEGPGAVVSLWERAQHASPPLSWAVGRVGAQDSAQHLSVSWAALIRGLGTSRPSLPSLQGSSRAAGFQTGIAPPAPPVCAPRGLVHVSPHPQSLPLISASRWLLKRGELFLVEEPGLFRKIASRPTCYLFLFNDVLVVTKKKRWAWP